MAEGVYIGFDFGLKRIGMAVGQKLTHCASPLPALSAKAGVPDWNKIKVHINGWKPQALVVGLPTKLDGGDLYVTKASENFADKLKKHYNLPVYLEDERLSTIEARAQIFASGGYKKLKNTNLDSIAACVILEQWLKNTR